MSDIGRLLESSRIKDRQEGLKQLEVILEDDVRQDHDWAEITESLLVLICEERRGASTTSSTRLLLGLVLLRRCADKHAAECWKPKLAAEAATCLVESMPGDGDESAGQSRLVAEIIRCLRVVVSVADVARSASLVAAVTGWMVLSARNFTEYALLVGAMIRSHEPVRFHTQYIDLFTAAFADQAIGTSALNQLVPPLLHFILECLGSAVQATSNVLTALVPRLWTLKDDRFCRREIIVLMRVYLTLVERRIAEPVENISLMKEYAVDFLTKLGSTSASFKPLPVNVLRGASSSSCNPSSWSFTRTLRYTPSACNESVLATVSLYDFIRLALVVKPSSIDSRAKRPRNDDSVDMLKETLLLTASDSRQIKLRVLQTVVVLCESAFPFSSNAYSLQLIEAILRNCGDSEAAIQHWALFALGAIVRAMPADSLDERIAGYCFTAATLRVGIPVLAEAAMYCIWSLHFVGVSRKWDEQLVSIVKNGPAALAGTQSGLLFLASLAAQEHCEVQQLSKMLLDSMAEFFAGSGGIDALHPASLAVTLCAMDKVSSSSFDCLCQDLSFRFTEEGLIEGRLSALWQLVTLGGHPTQCHAPAPAVICHSAVPVAIEFLGALLAMQPSGAFLVFTGGLVLAFLRICPSSIDVCNANLTSSTFERILEELKVSNRSKARAPDTLLRSLLASSLCICHPWDIIVDDAPFPQSASTSMPTALAEIYELLWQWTIRQLSPNARSTIDDDFGIDLTKSQSRGFQMLAADLDIRDKHLLKVTHQISSWQFVYRTLPSTADIIHVINEGGSKPLLGLAIAAYIHHIADRQSTLDCEDALVALEGLASQRGSSNWTRRTVVASCMTFNGVVPSDRLLPFKLWLRKGWAKALLSWSIRLSFSAHLGIWLHEDDYEDLALDCFTDISFMIRSKANYFPAGLDKHAATSLFSRLTLFTEENRAVPEIVAAFANCCQKLAEYDDSLLYLALASLMRVWTSAKQCVESIWKSMGGINRLEHQIQIDLARCVAREMPFTDWPHSLFDCETPAQFFNKFLDDLAAELLISRKKDVLHSILQSLGIEAERIIRSSVVFASALGDSNSASIEKNISLFQKKLREFDDYLHNHILSIIARQLSFYRDLAELTQVLQTPHLNVVSASSGFNPLRTLRSAQDIYTCIRLILDLGGYISLPSFVQDGANAPLLFRYLAFLIRSAYSPADKIRLLYLYSILIDCHEATLSALSSEIICYDLIVLSQDQDISHHCASILQRNSVRITRQLSIEFFLHRVATIPDYSVLQSIRDDLRTLAIDASSSVHAKLFRFMIGDRNLDHGLVETISDLCSLFKEYSIFPAGFICDVITPLLPLVDQTDDDQCHELLQILLQKRLFRLSDEDDKAVISLLFTRLSLVVPESVAFPGTTRLVHDVSFVAHLSHTLLSNVFSPDFNLGYETLRSLSLVLKSSASSCDLVDAHPELSVLCISRYTVEITRSILPFAEEWRHTSVGRRLWLTRLTAEYLIRIADISYRSLHCVARLSPIASLGLLPFAIMKYVEELGDSSSQATHLREVGGALDRILGNQDIPDIQRDVLSLLVGLRHAQENASSKFELHRWIPIDFIQAAQAALRLGNGAMAVNLLEVYRESVSVATDEEYFGLLSTGFEDLGDKDARSGTPLLLSGNFDAILVELAIEDRWMKKLQLLEGSLSDPSNQELSTTALNAGFSSIFKRLGGGVSDDLKMGTAATWRLAAWNSPRDSSSPQRASPSSDIAFLLVEDCPNEFRKKAVSLLTTATDLMLSASNLQAFDEYYHKAVFLSSLTLTAIDVERLPFHLAESILFANTVRKEHELRALSNTEPSALSVCDDLHSYSRFCVGRGQIMYATAALQHFQLIGQEFAILDHGNVAFAEVMWALREGRTAVRLLTECSGRFLDAALFPRVLLNLGNWSATLRLAQPDTIISEFLSLSVELATRSGDRRLGVFHHTLAEYCDKQFHIASSPADTDMIERVRRTKLDELKACEDLLANARPGAQKNSLENQRRKIKLQIEHDNERDAARLQRLQSYLALAVQHYLASIRSSDEYNADAFRLTSLWLANWEVEELSDLIIAGKVPSYKFLYLMHQLAARLQSDASRFQQALTWLLSHALQEHPFHSLYQIIAIRNSSVVNQKTASQSEMSRLKASDSLIRRTAKIHPAITRAIEKLCDAYRHLSELPCPPREQISSAKYIPLESGVRIRDIKDIGVPVLTISLPIRPDGDYSSVPQIHVFEPRYRLAGGVNLPKIINCIGSNGRKYKQLVKSNDDLRQDAVMQNVFGIVNMLFQKNYATRSRRLVMRSYKVIPLSARHGVLEWVENTRPLGDFLADLHKRHNPEDLSPMECRKMMAEEHQQRRSTASSKLAVYRTIVDRFHPVFRFFFFEQYPDPVQWYEMRRNYTRSVAVSSIVGHVLGLGDRHPQNILMDLSTAQVIHIDLGIAFDLGKLLPTPERVPFRLTRDMTDGMGVTGIGGTFRRTSETTLQTLSDHREYVMSVLDVLRHDPLYQWQLSPLKLRKLNGADALESPGATSGLSTNVEAERALNSVSQRLDAALSAECRVNELTQAAQDERNLSQMFHGWQPWC